MDTIVEAMFQANEHANVIILTIPCWTRHSNGNSDATHQAVSDYNDRLKTWGNGRQNVTVIDINAGIIDVTSSTLFYGVSSMFNNPGSDGLHPNAQGDLLMAGNIARAMGYAGRTAGQERKDAGGLAINFHQGGQPPHGARTASWKIKVFPRQRYCGRERHQPGEPGKASISYSGGRDGRRTASPLIATGSGKRRSRWMGYCLRFQHQPGEQLLLRHAQY